uniref:glycosyltransferase n=1 Tax=Agathobacter sp. TaxID=2021311 RepID=UPI004057086A
MSKISIIVPIYKVESYIRKCIDSIIAQTHKSLEIILVDDGSPDNCPAICDEYALIDERIKVIHQKNSGLSEARNAGIKNATGQYIGFVDSDDYIAPNMYEELLKLIEDAEADLAICNYQYVNESGKNLFFISPMEDEIFDKENIFKKLEAGKSHYYVTAWNKLYKRELFKDISFPKGKLHEDEFIVHEIFYKCNKVVTTSNTYYYYVQRADSIMSGKMSIKRLDAIEAVYNRYLFYKQHEELHKYFPQMKQVMWSTYRFLAMNLDIHGSSERKRLKEAKMMFREVYKAASGQVFSKKDYLRYSMPELFVALAKLRKKMKIGKKLRLIKGLWKVIFNGWGKDYILLDTPEHGNIGDQAIVLAERQFLDEAIGKNNYIELTANEIDNFESLYAKFIPKKKVILINGGGFLGDIWPNEEYRVHRILKAFLAHKIVVFPQTVSYNLNTLDGRKFLELSQSVYSQHSNLTIFVRERKSYEFVQKNFPTVKTYLVPDIVLSYKHNISKKHREGVVMCLRADREKKLNNENLEYIKDCIYQKFGKESIRYTDTVVGHNIKPAQRVEELHSKLEEFAQAELVVTDRLHGMIFAAITETPCIALGNSNGKVKGVYEWMKEVEYVQYVDDTAEFEDAFRSIKLGVAYNFPEQLMKEFNRVLRDYFN